MSQLSIDNAQNGSSTTTTSNTTLAIELENHSTALQQYHYRHDAPLNHSGRSIAGNVKSYEDLRKSGKMTKSKGFVFTLNNFTPEVREMIIAACQQLFEAGKIQYFAMSHERGTQGTHHLQGCVFFKKRVLIAYVALNVLCVTRHNQWPYIATARGSMEANEEYIGKDPIGPITTFGEPIASAVGQGARTDIHDAVAFAQLETTTELDMVREHTSVYVKFSKALVRIRALAQFARANKIRLAGVSVHWYFGQTGSGKSHYVNAICGDSPETFHKSPGTKWFDGYDQHSTVWLDEFRSDWFSFAFMLRLFDPYAKLYVERKCGHLAMVANVFYVTSCMHPAEMWYNATGGRASSRRSETDKVEQLLRRIHCGGGSVVEFTKVRSTSPSSINLEEPLTQFTRKKWSHAQSLLKLAAIRAENDGEFATHPNFTLV